MDYLWTPWRYRYIASAKTDDHCVFCEAIAANDDRQTLILLRGEKNFIILNRYPYTSGHVMVVPYAHVPDLSSADPDMLTEKLKMRQQMKKTLKKTYRPEGFNIGMNLNQAAGTGI